MVLELGKTAPCPNCKRSGRVRHKLVSGSEAPLFDDMPDQFIEIVDCRYCRLSKPAKELFEKIEAAEIAALESPNDAELRNVVESFRYSFKVRYGSIPG